MKRTIFFFSLLMITSLLVGCGGITVDLGGSSSSSGSTYPLQSVIDSPADGSSMAMQPIEVNYHATAQDGVAAVELSVDGQVLNIYSPTDNKQQVIAVKYAWSPTAGGAHVVRVRAMSATGEWSAYAQATITIQAPAQLEPTATPTAGPTNTPQATSTPEGVQVISVQKSTGQMYFGANSCGPVKITFTVFITESEKVKQVLVFHRLYDIEDGGTNKWDGGHAMSPKGGGQYTFTFTESTILNPSGYEFTALNYQFAVVDKSNNVIARSETYKDVRFDICS